MCLRFSGARADGRPANQIGDVLWRDGVEQLSCGWQAEVDDGAEEFAGEFKSCGDVAGAIKVRVHDEALPADGGARLFKVHAHDQEEAVGDFAAEGGEALGVFAAGGDVVNGAGADNQEPAGVVTEDDAVDGFAAAGDERRLGVVFGHAGDELPGRGQLAIGQNVNVSDLLHK